VVFVHEPKGRDELSIVAASAFDAVRLVGACMDSRPGARLGPGQAAQMTVADRDRVLAALHTIMFGARIAGDASCRSCNEKFNFDFDLGELVAQASPDPSAAEAVGEGWYSGPGNLCFRLPTGEDEAQAAGLDAARAARVIAQCCLQDPEAATAEGFALAERLTARLAPLVDRVLDAACPECGASNPMSFSIERYFLSSIMADRGQLMREIHRMAAGYGWSLAEILSLPRSQRQTLALHIERDADRALKRRSL
jgi:hypothetical protein